MDDHQLIADVQALFADLDRRQDPHGPAAGTRLLICPVRGQARYANLVEGFVANAIRLRGGVAAEIACDGVLPACDNLNQKSAEHKADFCRYCWDCHQRWFAAFGIPTLRLSEIVTPKEIAAFTATAAALDLPAIFAYTQDGLALGAMVKTSLHRFFVRGTLGVAHVAMARKYLVAALINRLASRRIVASFQPTCLWSSHGIYVTWGVYTGYAQQIGLPHFVYGQVYLRDRTLITKDASYHHFFQQEDPAVWNRLRLSPAENEVLDRYLQSKTKGVFDLVEHRYQPTEPASLTAIRQRLALRPGRTVLGLFTNVVWDAAIHSTSAAFDDMQSWVLWTIDWARQRGDIELIVRVHPAEAKHYFMRTEERLIDEINRRFGALPDHIHLIPPDDDIVSYDLAELLDVGVVYTTSLGYELAARGLPLIVAGDARYARKGFSYDAGTKDEYRRWLEQADRLKVRDAQRTALARLFTYHLTFRRGVPFRVFETPGPDVPEQLLIHSLDDLAPGGLPEIDAICNGIAHNRDILWDGPQTLPPVLPSPLPPGPPPLACAPVEVEPIMPTGNLLLAAVRQVPPGARYALFGAGQFLRRWLPRTSAAELNEDGRVFAGVIDDRPATLPDGSSTVPPEQALAEWRLDAVVLSTDTYQGQLRARLAHAGAEQRGIRVFAPVEQAGAVTEAVEKPRERCLPSGVEYDREILNSRGEGMGMTIRRYNRDRLPRARAVFDTLCHAPFVSLDLGPQGQINVCNHFHRRIANIQDRSMLEVFRGPEFTKLRHDMLEYRIDEMDCRHCARQIRAGRPEGVFACDQYDYKPARRHDPPFPTLLTFRLANTCNLKCIMCTGTLSSRIRQEREQQPPYESPYDEKFFQEMEQVLPTLDHLEFFGGEPFLIQAHLRIFELLKQTGARCTIYVNTNATTLTDRVKGYLETLNFRTIAVSMDALSPRVLTFVRRGLDYDRFMANLNWLLELRCRRPVKIVLNVTETRHNWFELPRMFAFAHQRDCLLHINTCLHPLDCTLYDLPLAELAYVTDYLEEQERVLCDVLARPDLANSYAYLLGLLRDHRDARRAGIERPKPEARPYEATDGSMAVPNFFDEPFETPAKVLRELERMRQFGVRDFGRRFAAALAVALAAAGEDGWTALREPLARFQQWCNGGDEA